MKKCVNGNYIEMTAEEIAELQSHQIDIPQEPTLDERIAELEEQLSATKILLGVE